MHTDEDHMVNYETTLEARAWQTNTVQAGTTSRVYPITRVTFVYTGKPWYNVWWQSHLPHLVALSSCSTQWSNFTK